MIFIFQVLKEDLSRLHTSCIAHLSIYLEVYVTHHAGHLLGGLRYSSCRAFIGRFTVKMIFRFEVPWEDLSRLHTSFIAHLSIYWEVYATHHAGHLLGGLHYSSCRAFIRRFTLLIMQGIY